MKANIGIPNTTWKRVASNSFGHVASHSGMLKQSLHLAAFAACHAGLAMLMTWYVVARTGVNIESDAFFASSALPQFVFAMLATTVVPVLAPLLAVRDDIQFRNDSWSFFSLIAVVVVIVAVILGVSSQLWVPWIVPGFSAAGMSLTLHLTRIQLASMVLNAMIVMLWAAHHARQKFLWVELSGSLANVGGLAFLVLTLHRFGISAAAWNTVLVNSLKLMLLFPILGRWRRPAWNSFAMKEAWRRLRPLLPGHLYLRTEPMLDRVLASMTGAGSLSLLYVAQQIYASILMLLGKAVAAPMTTKLAIDAKASDSDRYRATYHSRLGLMLVVTCSCFVLLVTVGPLLTPIIGHSGIAPGNIRALWLILVALVGTLVGGALWQVTASAFYALGNTRTPTKFSAVVYTLFIPLKIAAFLRYGILGLAVTMSSHWLINFLIQYFALRSSLRSIDD